MKASVVQHILEQFGKAERSGQELKLPGHTEAQLFVALGNEALTVQKVSTVEIREEYLVATTAKGERFFFGYEDVTGLKLDKSDEKKAERSAGFSR